MITRITCPDCRNSYLYYHKPTLSAPAKWDCLLCPCEYGAQDFINHLLLGGDFDIGGKTIFQTYKEKIDL